MQDYKLASFKEHSGKINESVMFALLLPVLVVALGKIVGYTIGKFKGDDIRKSMDNLSKSRFAEKSKEKDIKQLYDLIVRQYPDIIEALDSNDMSKLSNDLKAAGLNKSDEAEINSTIAKLRAHHNSN